MPTVYLKVKIKSLAAEQAIIRHEERKQLGSRRWLTKKNLNDQDQIQTADRTWDGLRNHRLNLRLELRAALVAYGYLRARAYRQIEQSPWWLKTPFCRQGPDWSRVVDMIWKYGPFNRSASKAEIEKAKKVLWDQIVEWRKITPAAGLAQGQMPVVPIHGNPKQST